jgi:hypothetical protein
MDAPENGVVKKYLQKLLLFSNINMNLVGL